MTPPFKKRSDSLPILRIKSDSTVHLVRFKNRSTSVVLKSKPNVTLHLLRSKNRGTALVHMSKMNANATPRLIRHRTLKNILPSSIRFLRYFSSLLHKTIMADTLQKDSVVSIGFIETIDGPVEIIYPGRPRRGDGESDNSISDNVSSSRPAPSISRSILSKSVGSSTLNTSALAISTPSDAPIPDITVSPRHFLHTGSIYPNFRPPRL